MSETNSTFVNAASKLSPQKWGLFLIVVKFNIKLLLAPDYRAQDIENQPLIARTSKEKPSEYSGDFVLFHIRIELYINSQFYCLN